MFGAQLDAGQDVDAARGELLADARVDGAEPITAEELRARAGASGSTTWEQSLHQPERSACVVGRGRAGRLAAVLPAARPRARLTLADVQRVARRSCCRRTAALGTYLPTDKPQRAPPPSGSTSPRGARATSGRAAAARPRRSTPRRRTSTRAPQRFDAGQRHEGRAAAQGHARPRGARRRLMLRFGDEKSLLGVGEVPGIRRRPARQGHGASSTRQQIQDRFDRAEDRAALQRRLEQRARPHHHACATRCRRRSRWSASCCASRLPGGRARGAAPPGDRRHRSAAQGARGAGRQRARPARQPVPARRRALRRSFDEMVADVQAVTVEQVRDFHARFYGATQREFAAVGDLDAAAVRAALASAFGDWNSRRAPSRACHSR